MRHDRNEARLGSVALVAMASLCALALPSPSSALGPLTVGGGYDYYQGPADQITQGPVGVAGVSLGPVANFSVTGMRYDDNHAGKGTAVTGGVGFPVLPAVQVRTFLSRYVGDDAYRAWRLKVGPQLSVPTGQSIGVFYSRYTDNGDAVSDGATAELASKLVAGLSGKVTAAYAKAEGLKSGQGSVGLSWTPIGHLELSGELGLARKGAVATQPIPPPGGIHLPLIGGTPPPGSTTTEEVRLERTALVGMRIWFP